MSPARDPHRRVCVPPAALVTRRRSSDSSRMPCAWADGEERGTAGRAADSAARGPYRSGPWASSPEAADPPS
ncbi:hypothetical protein GCM10023405_07820 [Streptomonospora salina]